MPHVDIALCALDDCTSLFGDTDPNVATERWRSAGVSEVVVTEGGAPCLVIGKETTLVPARAAPDVVDTSGAGDAFNAGYLHARLHGQTPEIAAQSGHDLAAWIVGLPGALPARDENAPYARVLAGSAA
jgi:2-dehydro-3-deoxygluconokinase